MFFLGRPGDQPVAALRPGSRRQQTRRFLPRAWNLDPWPHLPTGVSSPRGAGLEDRHLPGRRGSAPPPGWRRGRGEPHSLECRRPIALRLQWEEGTGSGFQGRRDDGPAGNSGADCARRSLGPDQNRQHRHDPRCAELRLQVQRVFSRASKWRKGCDRVFFLWSRLTPNFDPLHKTPRFQKLVAAGK